MYAKMSEKIFLMSFGSGAKEKSLIQFFRSSLARDQSISLRLVLSDDLHYTFLIFRRGNNNNFFLQVPFSQKNRKEEKIFFLFFFV